MLLFIKNLFRKKKPMTIETTLENFVADVENLFKQKDVVAPVVDNSAEVLAAIAALQTSVNTLQADFTAFATTVATAIHTAANPTVDTPAVAETAPTA